MELFSKAVTTRLQEKTKKVYKHKLFNKQSANLAGTVCFPKFLEHPLRGHFVQVKRILCWKFFNEYPIEKIIKSASHILKSISILKSIAKILVRKLNPYTNTKMLS